MRIKTTAIPAPLIDALDKESVRLKYSELNTVFACVYADYRNILVGVAGAGEMASYEWFIWDQDAAALKTSNTGYGCIGVALCCGLVASGASRANGDVLAWVREPEDEPAAPSDPGNPAVQDQPTKKESM